MIQEQIIVHLSHSGNGYLLVVKNSAQLMHQLPGQTLLDLKFLLKAVFLNISPKLVSAHNYC